MSRQPVSATGRLGGQPGPDGSGSLRVGIVGLGFVGGLHAEGVARTGLLAYCVAVANGSEGSTRRAAARHGIARAHASWQELIDDPDVDVVHNCTPNALHAEVATAAIAAGKHLITEKPLATSVADASALAQLTRNGDAVAALCHNYRHYAMVQEARALIERGVLGTPHHAHGVYLQDWLCDRDVENWRLDPGVRGASLTFADIGTHCCDLICHLLGDRVHSLAANFGELVAGRGEDHADVLFRLASGALGSLHVSQASAGSKNALSLRIDGSEGSVAWHQERPDELWVGRPGGAGEWRRKDGALLTPTAAGIAHYPAGHTEGWGSTFKNMFLSVYGQILGRAEWSPVHATLEDGHELMRVIDAVLTSARERSWVVLNENLAPGR